MRQARTLKMVSALLLSLCVASEGCSYVRPGSGETQAGKQEIVGAKSKGGSVDRSFAGPAGSKPGGNGPGMHHSPELVVPEPLFRERVCNGGCVDVVLDGADDYSFTPRYVESIGRRIILNVVYPWQTVEKGAEGTVEIHARVDRKGTLVAKELFRGSGKPLLDHAALSAVSTAAPFNPFPPSPYVQTIGFKVWFKYHQ